MLIEKPWLLALLYALFSNFSKLGVFLCSVSICGDQLVRFCAAMIHWCLVYGLSHIFKIGCAKQTRFFFDFVNNKLAKSTITSVLFFWWIKWQIGNPIDLAGMKHIKQHNEWYCLHLHFFHSISKMDLVVVENCEFDRLEPWFKEIKYAWDGSIVCKLWFWLSSHARASLSEVHVNRIDAWECPGYRHLY